jgi:hypothetical protein
MELAEVRLQWRVLVFSSVEPSSVLSELVS